MMIRLSSFLFNRSGSSCGVGGCATAASDGGVALARWDLYHLVFLRVAERISKPSLWRRLYGADFGVDVIREISGRRIGGQLHDMPLGVNT